jgi:hypothetical protein
VIPPIAIITNNVRNSDEHIEIKMIFEKLNNETDMKKMQEKICKSRYAKEENSIENNQNDGQLMEEE